MSKTSLIESFQVQDGKKINIRHNCKNVEMFKEGQIRKIMDIGEDTVFQIEDFINHNGYGWYFFIKNGTLCKSYKIKEDAYLTSNYKIVFKYNQEFFYFGFFPVEDYSKKLIDRLIKYVEANKYLNLLYNIYKIAKQIPFLFLSQFVSKSEDIFLVGENSGKTCNGNGYWFFNDLNRDNIYLVTKNKALYSEKNVIKYNSVKHYSLFLKSKNLVFTHGAKDVVPTLLYFSWNAWNDNVLIFLQHGTLSLKKIGIKSDSYYSGINKIVVSNDIESEICKKILGFDDRQLIRSAQIVYEHHASRKKEKRIFVMPTWGDYGVSDEDIVKSFIDIFSDIEQDFLAAYEIVFMLHPYAKQEVIDLVIGKGYGVGTELISFYLESSVILLTDYSSVVWNALYCGCRPICFFHHFDKYSLFRDTYLPYNYLNNALEISFDSDGVRKLLTVASGLDRINREFEIYNTENKSKFIFDSIN